MQIETSRGPLTFERKQHGGPHDTRAGIYLFCAGDGFNRPRPVYLGKCDCYSDRVHTGHEKWLAALRLATPLFLIFFAPLADEPTRTALEIELIDQLKPPLNDQHNPGSLAAFARRGLLG